MLNDQRIALILCLCLLTGEKEGGPGPVRDDVVCKRCVPAMGRIIPRDVTASVAARRGTAAGNRRF